MDKVVITKAKLDELAQEIAAKSEHPVAMTIDEMSQAVASISPKLEDEKTVTPSKKPQTIAPDIYHDGLSSVTVNPIPEQYVVQNLYNVGSVSIDSVDQYISPPYTVADTPRIRYQVTEPTELSKNGTSVLLCQYNQTDYSLYKTMIKGTATVQATYKFESDRATATMSLKIGDFLIDGEHPFRDYIYGFGDKITITNYTPDGSKYFPTLAEDWFTYSNFRKKSIELIFKNTGYNTYIDFTLLSLELGFYDVDYSPYTGLAPLVVPTIRRSIYITENGEYDVLHYSEAIVNVAAEGVNNQDKTVTPTTSQQSISADSGYTGLGIVTVNAIPSQYIVPSGNLAITANGTGIDVTQYASVSVDVPVGSTINNQDKTVTPTELQQTITADEGYTGLGTITVNAIPSTYVGSGITQRTSDDLTVSGATVSVPAGYYSAVASKSVATGTEGAPTASKGTVTNHSITVTPSVTNTAGYISGGTHSGTAVTISASELVSGTYSVTASGTHDVTNYASASVAAGSATAPSSISGTAASVSTGSGTLTLTKTVSVTPTVSAGYITSGTAGNSSVSLTANVTVNPTPTASGATVTIPAGYYTTQTTKSVSSGSATGPTSLSGSSATVTTGTNTLTLTKTGITTTPTVSAGYISSATASTATVTLTASVTTKAAATITPTTTNQTIASGTYLTGTQTIAGDADLVGSNILSTANIFGVQGEVVVQNVYHGSSAPSSSTGSNGDIYIQS